MLKARSTLDDGRPLIILGLEAGNLVRLQEGKPIHFDMAELGVAGECVILFGETKAAIVADLEKAGLKFPGRA